MRYSNHDYIRVAFSRATVVMIGIAFALPRGQVGTALASNSSGRKLHAAYEQQPATVGAPVCSPPASCVIPFSLLGVSTGDFAGTMAQAGAASILPDGSLYANSTLVFTGTVTGCGTGSITVRSTGLNRGGVTSGSIEIIEGSGTGGLASLTGNGRVISGEVDPATGIGRGAIEYKIKC